MLKKTFLLEIGTEELPSKSLRNLAESLATNFAAELNNVNLSYSNIKWFATPRRLALKVTNLSLFQPDQKIKKRGPSIYKAFDSKGGPNKTAKTWAKSFGINLNQTEHLITDNGTWLPYHTCIKGKSAESLLPKIVNHSLSKVPTLKLMRWGTGNIYFIRPVHSVTLLLDDKIIPATILGVNSDRIIYGHRFMGETKFIIDHANQYPQILLEHGRVIADYESRKLKIQVTAKNIAYKIGGNVDLSVDILEEIVSMVEWPVVLTGKFKEKFLSVPREILTCIIKNNQKCIPVYASDGSLLPNFIFVTNIESSNYQRIIADNERVMHSRMADADFFFKTDCQKHLEDNLPCLKFVLFHQELGNMREKTDRITNLSGWIACKIGADIKHTTRAGMLSKCDIVTNMVFEFSNTQGIMGMYYARHGGEVEDVAIALNEQYQPRFAGDQLPSNLISCSLAIADKIDTLVGIFGINQHPKGDRDPFALRRAAFGVLRIIVEKGLNLDLKTVIEKAVRLYGDKLTNSKVADDVINFILNRFYIWYENINLVKAVLACRPTRPLDFDARIKAISYFQTLTEASAIMIANKRISNILAKNKEKLNDIVDFSMLKETAEVKLAENLIILYNKLQPYFLECRYQEILIELASLERLIDDFFKNVTVNVDNEVVRINRLTLLSKLHNLFLQVADFSLLK